MDSTLTFREIWTLFCLRERFYQTYSLWQFKKLEFEVGTHTFEIKCFEEDIFSNKAKFCSTKTKCKHLSPRSLTPQYPPLPRSKT
jgi:hypothetical protein